MTDNQIALRNAEMLGQLDTEWYPKFRDFVKAMQSHGYRIRIQEAARTKERQLELWRAGLSDKKFGGKHVRKRALDVVDDNRPNTEDPDFFATLAVEAYVHGLRSGCLFGLAKPLKLKRQVMIERANIPGLARMLGAKRGWDPEHVEG